jgi:hypothetical protein
VWVKNNGIVCTTDFSIFFYLATILSGLDSPFRVAASGSHPQNVPSSGSILIPHTSIQASLSTACKSPRLPLRWYLSCDENWSLEFYQHTHACLIASWCDRPDLFVTCSETMTRLCIQSMKTNSSHWQGLIMAGQESFRLRCIHGCPFCLLRISRREGFGWLIDCPADKVDMKPMTTRKVTLCSHRAPCTDQEALPSDCPMLMYLSGV